ncbi:MAG: GAF domain-containing protein [Defluviitaleaceae bacterium]|nr:GAF domain-containing protein [Defluviitaleaceae bacterium]MCL2837273.1 GAF domain-containing protein [Defluviitaleaceae bacterium]
MFDTANLTLLESVSAITAGEPNLIANLANISALINLYTDRINWAGFYLLDEERGELVLGPFQGKPACVRIPVGKGVCGAAALKRETIVADDVHSFPGHIACDSASRSEIVVPIIKNGKLVGVLDIDSPEHSRFSDADRVLFEKLVTII